MLKIYGEKRNEATQKRSCATVLFVCVMFGGLWRCGDQGEGGRDRPSLAYLVKSIGE
jgi:hypothetical protein